MKSQHLTVRRTTSGSSSTTPTGDDDQNLSSSPPTPAPSPVPSTFYSRIAATTTDAAKSSSAFQNSLIATAARSRSRSRSKESTPTSDTSSKRNDTASSSSSFSKSKSSSSMIDRELLLRASHMFQLLSTDDKKEYLKILLHGSGREVLSSTQDFISPLLKKDPFQYLPREITFQILSHVQDAKSLARASQVSRLWYLLLSDDLTWKELCQSHHFRRLSAAVNTPHRFSLRLPSVSIDPANLVQDDLAEAIYDPDATKRPVPTSYRSHFKNEYMLNSAWNSGGRLAARYVINNQAVVTSLIMTDRYIVIALDNSKIFVFREDGKMLRSLFGHVMGVWALILTGDTLVSGGCDRDVRVWDLKTGNCLQILRGHTSTVRCLQMSDDRTALSGSRDTTIRVWDLEHGVCRRELRGHTASVRCLEVVGDLAVSGSYDFTARVWRISTGECLHVLAGHLSQIYCLAFDGERIATGALDASIRIWSAETGECLAILQGHTSLVGQVQMKGDVLVSGGSDGAVRVWDLSTYTCVRRFAAHDNSVTSLQFDEHRIVSGGSDGRVKVWDMNTGTEVRELSSHFDAVWRVAFRDEKVCILASKANSIYMELTSFTPPKELVETPRTSATNNIEFRTQFGTSKSRDDTLAPNQRRLSRLDGLEAMDLELPDQVAATGTGGDHSPPTNVDPDDMDLS